MITTRKTTTGRKLTNKASLRKLGQGMTEYIIIVGLIAIVLIGAINKFKTTVGNTYDASSASLNNGVTVPVTQAGSTSPGGAAATPATAAAK